MDTGTAAELENLRATAEFLFPYMDAVFSVAIVCYAAHKLGGLVGQMLSDYQAFRRREVENYSTLMHTRALFCVAAVRAKCEARMRRNKTRK